MEMTFREEYASIWKLAQQTMDKALQCDSWEEKMEILEEGKKVLYDMGLDRYGLVDFADTLMKVIKAELIRASEDLPFLVW